MTTRGESPVTNSIGENRPMFPFTDVARATANSLTRLLWLAQMQGVEGQDWVWEWRDGGRAAFSFRSQVQMEIFRTKRYLIAL
jgi:hypothetical protein